MKYSEFLQIKEILESNEITIEEFKDDSKLYEGIISNIGKGLVSLAAKGVKYAISRGINKRFKKKLDEDLKRITISIRKQLGLIDDETTSNQIKKPIEKEENEKKPFGGEKTIRDEPVRKTKETRKERKMKEEGPTEEEMSVQRMLSLLKEKKISRKIANDRIIKFIDEQIDSKSKIVVKSIDNKKGISENQRDNLKIYWNSKIAYIKFNLEVQLHEIGLVSDERIEEDSENLNKNLNKYLTILLSNAEERAKERGVPQN